jgi:cytidyltransferase-like protein
MRYKHAILGGTFDHFHAGHRYFISCAMEKSDKLTVGLVENIFEPKAFPYSLQSFEIRRESLKHFLKENQYKNVKIIPINNIFGNSLEESSIDAIFVTAHGFSNAKLINKKRKMKGMSELAIENVEFLRGKDGKIISSTRIRSGEIDRKGFPYLSLFRKTLVLPHNLRVTVRNTPSGILIKTDKEYLNSVKNKFVISVGDIVSGRLIKLGEKANLSIIDFKTKRKEQVMSDVEVDISEKNKAGTIGSRAVKAIKKAIDTSLESKMKLTLKIIGEEDLLPLPSALIAPLNSIILYGMPDKGAVIVNVTEEKKVEVRRLIEKLLN